jgi:hypothetical protein
MFRKPKPPDNLDSLPKTYDNLNSLPKPKIDEISRNCKNPRNYAECARRYADPNEVSQVPSTNKVDDEQVKHRELMRKISMEKDEAQKIIRYKLEKIKEAVEKNLMNIGYEQSKTNLRSLRNQLVHLEVVGNASDINKVAKVKANLSDKARRERDIEIAKIDQVLPPSGGRKRKTRKKTRRK